VPEIPAEREKILKYAQEKFSREGFYKISMDELAREMQVSKKTIYKHFLSKEKLVEAIVDDVISYINIEINNIIDSDESVVTKFVRILNTYIHRILPYSDRWVKDLQMHMPSINQKVDKFRTDKIYYGLNKLLRQGKKENLVENYPSEIIVASFVSTMRMITNPDFILQNRFSMEEAFRYIYEILLNGILTGQGKDNYIQTKKLLQNHK
jgi:AcrR family transcriptional regulator